MLKRLMGNRFNVVNMSHDGLDAMDKVRESMETKDI
eukprot:gene7368-9828_t